MEGEREGEGRMNDARPPHARALHTHTQTSTHTRTHINTHIHTPPHTSTHAGVP